MIDVKKQSTEALRALVAECENELARRLTAGVAEEGRQKFFQELKRELSERTAVPWSLGTRDGDDECVVLESPLVVVELLGIPQAEDLRGFVVFKEEAKAASYKASKFTADWTQYSTPAELAQAAINGVEAFVARLEYEAALRLKQLEELRQSPFSQVPCCVVTS